MSDDLLDRNLERLLRAHAAEPDVARARARFLRKVNAPRPMPFLVPGAAAILMTALLVWALNPPERPPGPTPEPGTPPPTAPEPAYVWEGGADGLQITVRKTEPTGNRARLRIEGRLDLPPRTGVKLSASVLEERVHGDVLEEAPQGTASGTAEMEDGRFAWEIDGRLPCRLRVRVETPDAHQDKERRELLKGLERRTWEADVSAWDFKFLISAGLGAEVRWMELGTARELTDRIEEACASRSSWEASKPALMKKLRVMHDARWQTLYPASEEAQRATLRTLIAACEHFEWEGEAFKGPRTYYEKGGPLKTADGQAFTFDGIRKALDGAARVAGRELALWMVKDARISGVTPRTVQTARTNATKPGLPRLAARLLQEPDAAALDAIERDARDLTAGD